MAIRIRRAEVYIVRIPLRFAVAHARASRTANVTGFVVLEADDGTRGIGEFLCREYVTGERPEDCVNYLRRAGPDVMPMDIADPLTSLQSLRDHAPHMPGRTGALGGLELAVLDLYGKCTGSPVATMLQRAVRQPKQTIRFSATYPFARGIKLSLLHLFYRTVMRMEALKIKGTGQIETDQQHVVAIRRAFPYPISIRIDLNGSMRPEGAAEYCARMVRSEARVHWFEQPFAKEDWEHHRRLQGEFGDEVVLCADESITSLEDLHRAVHEGAFRAVNIRVAKHGGIIPALQIYERAQAAGLQTALGCLVGESSVLAYAGLHLASLTVGHAFCEGCFGTYLITWDVIQPSLRFSRRGSVPLSRLPAAGVVPHFDIQRLRRAATQIVEMG